MSILFDDGTSYKGTRADDVYMRAFLCELLSRSSCDECKFTKLNRVSDLTLGDFWGIENVFPEFDDDKGCSVLLIYNDHSLNFVNELTLEKLDASLDKVSKGNYSLYGSAQKPVNRSFFFEQIRKGRKISSSYKASISSDLYWKLRRKIYRIIGV